VIGVRLGTGFYDSKSKSSDSLVVGSVSGNGVNRDLTPIPGKFSDQEQLVTATQVALARVCPTQFGFIAAHLRIRRICNKFGSSSLGCIHHRNVFGKLHVDQHIQAAFDLIPPCGLLGRDHILEDRHVFR